MECIILCGGEAKRMKPYLPFNKAQAEIKPGITLIEHQIHWLTTSGIDRIILAIDRETYRTLRKKGYVETECENPCCIDSALFLKLRHRIKVSLSDLISTAIIG